MNARMETFSGSSCPCFYAHLLDPELDSAIWCGNCRDRLSKPHPVPIGAKDAEGTEEPPTEFGRCCPVGRSPMLNCGGRTLDTRAEVPDLFKVIMYGALQPLLYRGRLLSSSIKITRRRSLLKDFHQAPLSQRQAAIIAQGYSQESNNGSHGHAIPGP
jgi:hypothetical protein